MQVHIVHAHPEPKSFNAELTNRARVVFTDNGHGVHVSDLYAKSFDPIERGHHYLQRIDDGVFSPLAEQRHAYATHTVPHDVLEELLELERSDLLVLQFPLWWHAPPAILKGWFDRVFLNGGIYTSRKRYDAGHFRGRRALVSVTSGAPEAAFGPGARGGDPEVMLWPVQYSLHYLGFSVLRPQWTFGVQGHGYSYDDESLARHRLENGLRAWEDRLLAIHSEPCLRFPGWQDWDDQGRPKSGL